METPADHASENVKETWFSYCKRFFLRCWLGRASCSEAFWVLLVSGSVVLMVVTGLSTMLMTAMNAILKSASPGAAEAGEIVIAVWLVVFGIGQLGFFVCSLISVWRCAPNAARRAHAVLARIVVLAVAASLLGIFLGGVRQGVELTEQRRGGTGTTSDSGGYRMVDSWPMIVQCGWVA